MNNQGPKYWIRLLVDCIALDRYPQWLLDKVTPRLSF